VNGLRFALLLACFFLSGFAALIYQTAWTRQFAFVFGTSELAVATVLAAYMGGLAAGAVAAARFVGRVRRPVLVYGVLELGIALAALCVPAALDAATALYVALFGGSNDPADAGGLVAALFYLVSSGAILLVPTGLMGATLPLLARHAVRRESEIGSRVGLLYAINTVGAVAGTVGAGFLLLPRLGLLSTIHVGVAVNGLVFLAAALVARGAEPLPAPGPRSEAAPTTGRWILPLVMISGAVSFSYEVLWSRLLGHLLGGSVYGFATMLASFLAGIAEQSRSCGPRLRACAAGHRLALAAGLLRAGPHARALSGDRRTDRRPHGGRRCGRGGDAAARGTVPGRDVSVGGACVGAAGGGGGHGGRPGPGVEHAGRRHGSGRSRLLPGAGPRLLRCARPGLHDQPGARRGGRGCATAQPAPDRARGRERRWPGAAAAGTALEPAPYLSALRAGRYR
jgi:hypothetical protein